MSSIEKNIYKRNDGRYEARFIKGRNEKGRAIYGAVYANSLKEVKEKRRKAAKELIAQSSSKYSIAQVLESHLADIQKNIKSSTHLVYKGYINKHVSQYFKDMTCEQLSLETLQAFADWLIENGLSTATVQAIFAFIKRAFEGIDEQNIFDIDLSMYIDIDYLTVEEQKKLETAAKSCGGTIYMAVILCLYMGLLVDELCTAQWSDIDFNNRLFYVKQTMNRTIPIPKFLLDLLQEHKKNSDSNSNSTNSEDYILSKDGLPIKPRNIQYRLQILLKETGIRQTSFNALRNTFAVRALENGVDIETLSEILGHSKPEITIKRYEHIIKNARKLQCMEKMISVYES